MSGFTANVRKYGVNHVASLILKQREVLKPIWEAYGALDIWYEADNNWCTFPNVGSAVLAALEAGRIITEYNSNIKPGFELLVAGFGIDSGDEVIKNLHEGKIFGASVDTAFFLGEDVVTKTGVLVSERAWNSVKDNHASFCKLTATPGEDKGVKYVSLSGDVANPVCKLNPPSHDKPQTPLQLLCSRATFPETAEAVDAEVNAKFISPKTAMFFGFEGQSISKKYGLLHYLKVASALETVIRSIFSSFKGGEKEIFNYWLFDDPSNALRAVLTAKQAILAHNALCAPEDYWPVKGFGLHSSPVLRLPGTDICFGDAANTASKLSEDAGENLSVYVTKVVMDGVGFIKGLKTEAQVLSVSGVNLECYLVDLKTQ
jgi:class 3 adenylate cyclase